MNRGMLKRKLAIADHLDDYIVKHQRWMDKKPDRIHITAKQMAMLEEHAVDGARLTDWCGIPLEVRG